MSSLSGCVCCDFGRAHTRWQHTEVLGRRRVWWLVGDLARSEQVLWTDTYNLQRALYTRVGSGVCCVCTVACVSQPLGGIAHEDLRQHAIDEVGNSNEPK